MKQPNPTIGTIDTSTRPDEILSHDARMTLKSDVQRDVARANTMPARHAENILKDAKELEAKAGV